MKVYVYKDSLYCEDCADHEIAPVLHSHSAEFFGLGSDSAFVGPYWDGGGKADMPHHCDNCGVHLENPLTGDGIEYIFDALSGSGGNRETLETWADFYRDELREMCDIWLESGEMFVLSDFDSNPMLQQELLECSPPGQDASMFIEEIISRWKIAAHPDIADHLESYGAWSREDGELDDHRENIARVIWLMSGAFNEHPDTFGGEEPFHYIGE